MPLNKFIPVSPDLSIRDSQDMTLAKFAHLNVIVDYINNSSGGGSTNSLQLPLGTLLDSTLREVQDGTGTNSPLLLSTTGLRIGSNAGSAIYWDDTDSKLGFGIPTPEYNLDVFYRSRFFQGVVLGGLFPGIIYFGNESNNTTLSASTMTNNFNFSSGGENYLDISLDYLAWIRTKGNLQIGYFSGDDNRIVDFSNGYRIYSNSPIGQFNLEYNGNSLLSFDFYTGNRAIFRQSLVIGTSDIGPQINFGYSGGPTIGVGPSGNLYINTPVSFDGLNEWQLLQTDTTASGSSGQYAVVNINGTSYKIELLAL